MICRGNLRRSVVCLAVSGLLGALSLSVGLGEAHAANASKLKIEASFYPLQWMAKKVGGSSVVVSNLTPPGAEPHDLELTPRQVARIEDADAVVYLHGFQPAVDDAVEQADADRAFDAAEATDLDLAYAEGEEHGHDDEDEEHGHDDEEAEHAEEGSTDPHFWLDPTKLAEVGDEFAAFLGELDPANASQYEANAAALRSKLEALDSEYKTGLASCSNTDLVTSHAAFGYLAARYGLTQLGISGLSPEEEPSPRDLAEVTEFVEDHDVRTIYFETLVSPRIAKTVASETGARTAVLDPIEGINKESQGRDYPSVMRANLKNLQKGQPCP